MNDLNNFKDKWLSQWFALKAKVKQMHPDNEVSVIKTDESEAGTWEKYLGVINKKLSTSIQLGDSKLFITGRYYPSEWIDFSHFKSLIEGINPKAVNHDVYQKAVINIEKNLKKVKPGNSYSSFMEWAENITDYKKTIGKKVDNSLIKRVQDNAELLLRKKLQEQMIEAKHMSPVQITHLRNQETLEEFLDINDLS